MMCAHFISVCLRLLSFPWSLCLYHDVASSLFFLVNALKSPLRLWPAPVVEYWLVNSSLDWSVFGRRCSTAPCRFFFSWLLPSPFGYNRENDSKAQHIFIDLLEGHRNRISSTLPHYLQVECCQYAFHRLPSKIEVLQCYKRHVAPVPRVGLLHYNNTWGTTCCWQLCDGICSSCWWTWNMLILLMNIYASLFKQQSSSLLSSPRAASFCHFVFAQREQNWINGWLRLFSLSTSRFLVCLVTATRTDIRGDPSTIVRLSFPIPSTGRLQTCNPLLKLFIRL